jgi:hypothetical protein
MLEARLSSSARDEPGQSAAHWRESFFKTGKADYQMTLVVHNKCSFYDLDDYRLTKP